MTANKAKFALTLSLALVLAACGGGGGGGSGDDDSTPQEPPSGFGDFDGSYTLRSRNNGDQQFNRTVTAAFVVGRATVNELPTRFDYPLDPQTGGCFYDGGAIEHCVERAAGQVLALCTSPNAEEISAVGIRIDAQATLIEATVQNLADAALARADRELELRALSCDNALDAGDTVTFEETGAVVQRFGSAPERRLERGTVDVLFGDGGISTSSPFPARLGSKAFKDTDGRFYVVNFGAPTSGAPSNSVLEPKLFVSVD